MICRHTKSYLFLQDGGGALASRQAIEGQGGRETLSPATRWSRAHAGHLADDGQVGALRRGPAKIDKFESDKVATLCSAAMAATLRTCTRGVATAVRRVVSADSEDGVHCWHAIPHWFRPRSVVAQGSSMARLISPKRPRQTRASFKLRSLTLGARQHEDGWDKSRASQRDMLDRLFGGPLNCEGRKLCNEYFWRKPRDHEAGLDSKDRKHSEHQVGSRRCARHCLPTVVCPREGTSLH